MATSRVLPITSNPYGGGAVIFDSSPATQYFINKKAREEANKNAFIKGFQDIGSNINAAGLDNNDVQDLYNKKAAWQQYVMGHQKEYQNPSLDNGRTYAEANRLYNDAAQHISAAKKKVENLKEAEKISLDPNKKDLLNESYYKKIEKARLPISDPNYRPIDFTDIYNPKPFDEAKYRTELNPYIKYSPKEGNTVTDKDFNTKTEVFEIPEYDKLQIFKIAENKYAQTPSYQREIKRLSNDPEMYKKYNQIFKDNFGQDLNITHPEEMAVAHTLSLMPQQRLKEVKSGFDRKGYFDYTNKITSAQKSARAEMVSNMGYNPRQHIEEIYNNGSDDNSIYPIKNGVDVKGREISLPDPLQDKYYDKVDGRVRRPDKVIMDNDKKNIHLIFFNGTSANGQPRVDQKKSRSIPVTSSIIPDLEKSFGNPKKNLSFGNQPLSSPKAVKETKTFVFPTGKKKF